ncbi:MAG: carbohydrate-binding family 9-like protein [Pyrinomonadaceae bacterium]|jgi:hypothetical protein|nr:carbohydrate-binding family 9-like protein [Pyrinomonadaceae bacterium]
MKNIAKIHFINQTVFLDESFEEHFWQKADEIFVKHYWSGVLAETNRHSKANLLWGKDYFWIRFVCEQGETLYINDKPNLTKKSIGLWDFDVAEIFISPDSANFSKYFEFEVSPTGEWLDLGIHQMPDKRETDWEFQSNMKVATKIEENRIIMVMQIPFSAFGKTPKVGEKWRGNLFRCVGNGENRGYLAWQPTLTEKPNFHVPEKFGWFEFVK